MTRADRIRRAARHIEDRVRAGRRAAAQRAWRVMRALVLARPPDEVEAMERAMGLDQGVGHA